jgi:uncharacterized membrane protein
LAKNPRRLPLIDLIRGLAISLMVGFHLCFNLSYFGFLDTDFYTNPFWLHSRTLIVSIFMFLVGVSLVLSSRKGINYSRFWQRIILIAGLAAGISLATYYLFPGRTIVFGVLHLIALASVMALLFLKFKWLNLFLGVILIILGGLYQNVWFDQPLVHWLGMMTHKPATEDYAPVLPWFGVVLLGMYFGRALLDSAKLKSLCSATYQNKVARVLNLMGRHSLGIYIIHQAILYPLIAGLALLV